MVREYPTRIDLTTLEILINEEHSTYKRNYHESDDISFSIGRWFSQTLDIDLSNVTRAKLPQEDKKVSLLPGLEREKHINMMQIDAYHFNPYCESGFGVDHNTPLYNLERLKRGRARFLAYRDLFVRQPQSAQEVRQRQQTFRELVENEKLFDQIFSLEKTLYQVAEPMRHVQDMSYLLSVDILRSRIAKPIHEKEFYADFMALSHRVVDLWDELNASLRDTPPATDDIAKLLSRINSMHRHRATRREISFLRSLLAHDPKEYGDLRELFEGSIKDRGVALNNKLERIDESKDTYDMSSFAIDVYLPEPYDGPKMSKFKRQFYATLPLGKMNMSTSGAAQLGAFRAAAKLFREQQWALPKILDESERKVHTVNGYHPLTRTFGLENVPNPTSMDVSESVEICDGPNAQGKTTEMRKTLTIAALANLGMYVPVQSAQVSFFPYIRCRVKSEGMDASAFMSEFEDLKSTVLPYANKGLLFGLDEGVTSTNPLEGEALLYGIIRYLHESGANLMLTSHYPSLQNLPSKIKGTQFSHFSYAIKGGEIHSNHIKQRGPNPNPEYAIVMAEQKGLDREIVAKAHEFSKRLT